jgi:hypothetical protein
MVTREARCGEQGGTRTREGGGCQGSAKNTNKKFFTPTEAEGGRCAAVKRMCELLKGARTAL